MKDKKAITVKTLSKSNVWDLQENDIFRLLEAVEKDTDLKENMRHYTDIIKTAFDIEEIKVDKPEIIKKYEDRGFKVSQIGKPEDNHPKLAIKKRPILRVTDLTYENIRHISASKLIEVLERNFGGGWESLSQSIQDVIESGFDISTTTLPKDRLHKPGGLYEKKVNDGFEVLEIPKGLWIEAIFAKEKPEAVAAPSFLAEEDSEKTKRLIRTWKIQTARKRILMTTTSSRMMTTTILSMMKNSPKRAIALRTRQVPMNSTSKLRISAKMKIIKCYCVGSIVFRE